MSDFPHPVALAYGAAAAAVALTSLLRCLGYDRLLRAIVAKRPDIWERYLRPGGFLWTPDPENGLQSSMARAGFHTTLAAKSLPWPEDDPEILRLHTAYRRSVVRNQIALAFFFIPLAAALLWSAAG
jgi:hypothetical protein